MIIKDIYKFYRILIINYHLGGLIMNNIRVFISADLGSETKAKLAELQDNFKEQLFDVKWVEKHNFHITLKFIGDISIETIPSIKDSLNRVHKKIKPPLKIIINSTGIFPNINNPRVLWVGLKKYDALKYIYDEVEENLYNYRIIEKKTRFSPHITLGRFRRKPDKDILNKILKDTSDFTIVTELNSISIMKSELKSKGPVYTSIETFII